MNANNDYAVVAIISILLYKPLATQIVNDAVAGCDWSELFGFSFIVCVPDPNSIIPLLHMSRSKQQSLMHSDRNSTLCMHEMTCHATHVILWQKCNHGQLVAILISSFSVAVVAAVAGSDEGSVENSALISLGALVVVGIACVAGVARVVGSVGVVRDNLKAPRVLRMSFMDRRRFLGYF